MKQHKADRRKRFMEMASRIGFRDRSLLGIIFHSLGSQVAHELKLYALVWCYFGAQLSSVQGTNVTKYRADFNRLLSWTEDYRTWKEENQNLASSPGDPLSSLRYMMQLPEVVKLCLFRVPGVVGLDTLSQLFDCAVEQVNVFRTTIWELGFPGVMTSDKYQGTEYDNKRLRADYAELELLGQDWHGWSPRTILEAKAKGLAVLDKFQYLSEVPPEALVTYCRQPDESCFLPNIQSLLGEARHQLATFLEKGAK